MRLALGQSLRKLLPVVVAAGLLVLVIGCGSDARTAAPDGSVESIEVPGSDALSQTSAVAPTAAPVGSVESTAVPDPDTSPQKSPVPPTATPVISVEPTKIPDSDPSPQKSPVAPTATPADSVEPTEVPDTNGLPQGSPVPPTATPAGPVESTEVPAPDVSSLESAAQSASISIIFGRAILSPNGRVTLFYVTKDTSDEAKGGVVIDSASITSSDGRTWLADGYGELRRWASLTLGWLTFSMPEAAQGQLRVTVNSAQTGAGPVTGPWRGVEQLEWYGSRPRQTRFCNRTCMKINKSRMDALARAQLQDMNLLVRLWNLMQLSRAALTISITTFN